MKRILFICLALLTVQPFLAQAEMPAKGEILQFGHYEQDGNPGNGPEPVEWMVLDAQEDAVQLLSLYGLDTIPFENGSYRSQWELCSLRAWLNDSFFADAFTSEEQAAIRLTVVPNDAAQSAPKMNKDGGKDTEDHVFLLSYAEMMRSFPEKETRLCLPTPYAIERGAYTQIRTGGCDWWLRSPGQSGRAAIVKTDMEGFDVMYAEVPSKTRCVRPTMWVYFQKNPQ